jgi:hypothetical protein
MFSRFGLAELQLDREEILQFPVLYIQRVGYANSWSGTHLVAYINGW